MEELSDIIKNLDIECYNEDFMGYEFVNVFDNPNKLPINQIHLKEVCVDLKRDISLESLKSNDGWELKIFDHKTQVIPALSKRWLPVGQEFFRYQPYSFTVPKENHQFSTNNRLFLQTLHYLLSCNFHQFWCLVLFEPKVEISLHSFLLNPVMPHHIKNLDDDASSIYMTVFSQFRRVYERLTTFQENESEYMSDSVGLKYLLEKKLLNLPIVITLILLYQETNSTFVKDLTLLYFNGTSAFRDKEIEEMLAQIVMTLEMIGGHVCGFGADAVIVPIAVDPKPKVFDESWVFSVVNYLLNTISSVHALLNFYKSATAVALEKGLPYRLSYTYEHVFREMYEYINERKELEENPKLSEMIFEEIALGRSEFVDVYNAFVTYCLDKALQFRGDHVRREEFVEVYLKLMNTALEDEYFITDYNERYDVAVQNEMFSSCTDLDQTRTEYILNCITCLKRHNRLWKTLNGELKTMNKAIEKYARSRRIRTEPHTNGTTGINHVESSHIEEKVNYNSPSEEAVENSIKIVVDMFPHLGDGFVLQCLEAYNYQASDVISAILEENLPPHLVNIPFDQIRIPPEPKPPSPILAYKGKKPDYDNALQMLNDKKDLKEIKTFILDGIQYTNQYDMYDDDYDDRLDDATVAVADHGSEDILRFNPNYEDDAVSDTSYSENEYDEKGQHVQVTNNDKSKGKGNFCEDPAVLRARAEARRRSQGKHPIRNQDEAKRPGRSQDVVGKPKGQGQEKNVVQNRQKKTVNKSSRANHKRKDGAQWKRNRGMIPS